MSTPGQPGLPEGAPAVPAEATATVESGANFPEPEALTPFDIRLAEAARYAGRPLTRNEVLLGRWFYKAGGVDERANTPAPAAAAAAPVTEEVPAATAPADEQIAPAAEQLPPAEAPRTREKKILGEFVRSHVGRLTIHRGESSRVYTTALAGPFYGRADMKDAPEVGLPVDLFAPEMTASVKGRKNPASSLL